MCVPCLRSHPSSSSSKPKRSRTKTRRPKFLSLRRHLSAAYVSAMPPAPQPPDPHLDEPQVASLLDPVEDDAGGSLSALLGAASASAAPSDSASPPSSASMNWDGEAAIARRVLRGRERWVFCCRGGEVGSPASEQEACSGGEVELLSGGERKGLSLKLDYEEILTAWSDKGSLYIEKGDPPGHQVVPEVHHSLHACDAAAPAVFVDVRYTGNAGSLWRVPEAGENAAAAAEEDGREGRVSSGSNNREQRVRRYKEKRQNRLFSKRIRYEVRKLNAEKRPRMKGRFVKRMDDI